MIMAERAELLIIANELPQARGGLLGLLDDVKHRHLPAVWQSEAAEASRLRLRRINQPLLLSADRHLAVAVRQLRAAAAAASEAE